MRKIQVFHGADSKTGTTMITQSIAEYITSNNKNLKVIVVSMHGKPGTDYAIKVGESIEGIKLHLDNKLLNMKKLIEECRWTDNLYFLGGVESIEHVRHYNPNMAKYLLESLEGEFDLILVDAGNEIDNALAVGALEYGGEKHCILTQQETILKRYEKKRPIFRKLGINFSSFIVNKHIDEDIYDLRYIERRLSLPREQVVKIGISGYERLAESERKTLLYYRNEGFCRDIHDISNDILSRADIASIKDERKKRWLPFI